jgi:hypothetical protein
MAMLSSFLVALQLITFNLGEDYTIPPNPSTPASPSSTLQLESYRVNQETLVLTQNELTEEEDSPMLYSANNTLIALGAFNSAMYEVQHIGDFNGDGLDDVLIEGNTGASSYNTVSYLITSQGKGRYSLQTFSQFVQAYRFGSDKALHIAAYAPADFKYARDVNHAMWTYWPTLYSWQGGKYKGIYKINLHRDFYTQKVRSDYQKEIANLRESTQAGDQDARKAIAARQAALAFIDKKFRK